MQNTKREEEVSTWPHVSLHAHRFGGPDFLFDQAEIGDVPIAGIIDIPFPRSVVTCFWQKVLLRSVGPAASTFWVQNSGWITFQMRSEPEDALRQARWLMRLSYLRYALKTASEPRKLFEGESEQLRLSPEFKSLLEPFVPKTANHVSVEPLSAQFDSDSSILKEFRWNTLFLRKT